MTGYYDTSVKSVIIDAKRRGGKLTYLEVAGRLNGEAPVAVHVDQRGHDARMLVSDATDAGSAFRLVGFYPAMRGGTMNLRVNLDGSGGADKTGVLDVRRFVVTGDEVVGKVISQAEREGARHKPDPRNSAQHDQFRGALTVRPDGCSLFGRGATNSICTTPPSTDL